MSSKTLGLAASIRIGAIYYWAKGACLKGHTCARYVSDGACFNCVALRDVDAEKRKVLEMQEYCPELLSKMEAQRSQKDSYKTTLKKARARRLEFQARYLASIKK